MPRVIVLGCGTGVGKTWASVALIQSLERRGHPCLGLKPVESGLGEAWDRPLDATNSDAAALRNACSLAPHIRSPPYGFSAPISPHLAARDTGRRIDIVNIVHWTEEAEQRAASAMPAPACLWTIVETAGGVFSPLSLTDTNFDLARQLEPAIWLLVGADSLGVLHDVSATWQAMVARGRAPDHLLLSQAREADASTGRNEGELTQLGRPPIGVLKRGDFAGCAALTEALISSR